MMVEISATAIQLIAAAALVTIILSQYHCDILSNPAILTWSLCCDDTHTDVFLLSEWILIRVGDVGMDMARLTRVRIDWLSIQWFQRFRIAMRTLGLKGIVEEK